MVKAFYVLISCNLLSAAIFFGSGVASSNVVLKLVGVVFIGASLLLFIFLWFVRRKYPTLK
jgi:hypothetical protein